MDKFGWCFIGTGRLAEEVAKQISAGNHKIVSCYTRNYENGKKFAEKYGTTAYQTAEEAILAEGVEAVYIVTPHNAHFRYVKKALELGKPVFCEKAFTVTAEETDELIRIAGEKTWCDQRSRFYIPYEIDQLCTKGFRSKACRWSIT